MVALPLSYIPILESLHVYLNGVEQYEPTDWVYNPVSNLITAQSAMEAVSTDLLEARYAHLGIVPPPPLIPTSFLTNSHGNVLASAITNTIPTVVAGDLILYISATKQATLTGFTNLSDFTLLGDFTAHNNFGGGAEYEHFHVLYKVSDGTESGRTVGFTTSGTGWGISSCVTYHNAAATTWVVNVLDIDDDSASLPYYAASMLPDALGIPVWIIGHGYDSITRVTTGYPTLALAASGVQGVYSVFHDFGKSGVAPGFTSGNAYHWGSMLLSIAGYA